MNSMRCVIPAVMVACVACYPEVATVLLEVDERNLRYRVHISSSRSSEFSYNGTCFDTSMEGNANGFSLAFRDRDGELVLVYGEEEWVPFTADCNFYPPIDSNGNVHEEYYKSTRLPARTRTSSDWYPLEGAIVGAMPYSDYRKWHEMQVRFEVTAGHDFEPVRPAQSAWMPIPTKLIERHKAWAEDPQRDLWLEWKLNRGE